MVNGLSLLVVPICYTCNSPDMLYSAGAMLDPVQDEIKVLNSQRNIHYGTYEKTACEDMLYQQR